MALSEATLATELKALPLFNTEATAIQAWANAFSTYFGDAASNGVTIAPAAIPAAKAAMIAQLSGMSGADQGATKIGAGIVAFWGGLVPATAWPTTTVIIPPALLAGLISLLQAVFDANAAGAVSKETAMDNIAAVLHTNNQGGTATWPIPGPGIQPIT